MDVKKFLSTAGIILALGGVVANTAVFSTKCNELSEGINSVSEDLEDFKKETAEKFAALTASVNKVRSDLEEEIDSLEDVYAKRSALMALSDSLTALENKAYTKADFDELEELINEALYTMSLGGSETYKSLTDLTEAYKTLAEDLEDAQDDIEMIIESVLAFNDTTLRQAKEKAVYKIEQLLNGFRYGFLPAGDEAVDEWLDLFGFSLMEYDMLGQALFESYVGLYDMGPEEAEVATERRMEELDWQWHYYMCPLEAEAELIIAAQPSMEKVFETFMEYGYRILNYALPVEFDILKNETIKEIYYDLDALEDAEYTDDNPEYDYKFHGDHFDDKIYFIEMVEDIEWDNSSFETLDSEGQILYGAYMSSLVQSVMVLAYGYNEIMWEIEEAYKDSTMYSSLPCNYGSITTVENYFNSVIDELDDVEAYMANFGEVVVVEPKELSFMSYETPFPTPTDEFLEIYEDLYINAEKVQEAVYHYKDLLDYAGTTMEDLNTGTDFANIRNAENLDLDLEAGQINAFADAIAEIVDAKTYMETVQDEAEPVDAENVCGAVCDVVDDLTDDVLVVETKAIFYDDILEAATGVLEELDDNIELEMSGEDGVEAFKQAVRDLVEDAEDYLDSLDGTTEPEDLGEYKEEAIDAFDEVYEIAEIQEEFESDLQDKIDALDELTDLTNGQAEYFKEVYGEVEKEYSSLTEDEYGEVVLVSGMTAETATTNSTSAGTDETTINAGAEKVNETNKEIDKYEFNVDFYNSKFRETWTKDYHENNHGDGQATLTEFNDQIEAAYNEYKTYPDQVDTPEVEGEYTDVMTDFNEFIEAYDTKEDVETLYGEYTSAMDEIRDQMDASYEEKEAAFCASEKLFWAAIDETGAVGTDGKLQLAKAAALTAAETVFAGNDSAIADAKNKIEIVFNLGLADLKAMTNSTAVRNAYDSTIKAFEAVLQGKAVAEVTEITNMASWTSEAILAD